MRSSTFFLAAASAGLAAASPARGRMMMDIATAVARRADWEGSSELWSGWSKAPKEIKALLMGKGSAIDMDGYEYPGKDTDACGKDKCCIWSYVTKDLYDLFRNPSGGCNDVARSAIRMGFHDAAAWDKTSSHGGADGSLFLDPAERNRIENGGGMALQYGAMQSVYDKYADYNIGMADFIQAGSKVATLACDGPRMKMLVGRPDSSESAPTGKLPPATGPGSDADSLIELFADKTVSAGGLIALLGAHTAAINHVPVFGELNPNDETPTKWDTNFFEVTLKNETTEGVTRFDSDVNLANSDKTNGAFVAFSKNLKFWNEAYAKEYYRMSLFGVKNLDELLDCTKAMPKGNKKPYPNPDPSSSYSSSYSSTSYSTSSGSYSHTSTYKPTYTTSTIYSTSTYTVTSCSADVVDCPYGPDKPHTTYTTYPISTTVCEVTPTEYPAGKETKYPDAEYDDSKPTIPGDVYPTDDAVYSSYAPEASYSAGSTSSYDAKPSVVVAGAGRTAAGVLAAAAGVVAALL